MFGGTVAQCRPHQLTKNRSLGSASNHTCYHTVQAITQAPTLACVMGKLKPLAVSECNRAITVERSKKAL